MRACYVWKLWLRFCTPPGMRISELTGLDLQSVDRANKTVRVLGKGNKGARGAAGHPGA